MQHFAFAAIFQNTSVFWMVRSIRNHLERSIAMATKTRQAAGKSGELGLFDLAEVLWQDNVTEAQYHFYRFC